MAFAVVANIIISKIESKSQPIFLRAYVVANIIISKIESKSQLSSFYPAYGQTLLWQICISKSCGKYHLFSSKYH